MDDKDANLRGKLEGLFSDLSDITQAEPSHPAPSTATPEGALRAGPKLHARLTLASLCGLAEHLTDAIIVNDLAGHVIYSNRASSDFLGYDYEQKDMIGLETRALWPDVEKARLTEEILPQAMTGRWQGETLQRRKDGSVLKTALTLFSLCDEQEHIIGTAAILRDLTSHEPAQSPRLQTRAFEENLLMQKLLDAIPAPIFYKDTNGVYQGCNTAFEAYLGRPRHDILGKSVYDMSPQDLADKYHEMDMALFRQPGVQVYESFVRYADGSRHNVVFHKATFTDASGALAGLVGIILDITERKQVEAEHQRLLAELEHRAIRLRTAAQVSQAANSILDLNELLPKVVELVREQFDLYYAGIFLVEDLCQGIDEAGEWAVLRAGSGEAGRKMMAAGHKLKVGGQSMIGWCVANRQARIALDVGKEAIRFENPALPETRSEMALPLISRGRVIGAMTIQSTQSAAFTEEDIATLQTMADQLANAIQNARLFEESQRLVAREQMLNTVMAQIRTGITLEQVLNATVQQIGKVLGTPRVAVWLGPAPAEPGNGNSSHQNDRSGGDQ